MFSDSSGNGMTTLVGCVVVVAGCGSTQKRKLTKQMIKNTFGRLGFLYLGIMVSEISTLFFPQNHLIVQYDGVMACFQLPDSDTDFDSDSDGETANQMATLYHAELFSLHAARYRFPS